MVSTIRTKGVSTLVNKQIDTPVGPGVMYQHQRPKWLVGADDDPWSIFSDLAKPRVFDGDRKHRWWVASVKGVLR